MFYIKHSGKELKNVELTLDFENDSTEIKSFKCEYWINNKHVCNFDAYNIEVFDETISNDEITLGIVKLFRYLKFKLKYEYLKQIYPDKLIFIHPDFEGKMTLHDKGDITENEELIEDKNLRGFVQI